MQTTKLKYLQVVDLILDDIEQGKLKPGSTAPSIKKLSIHTGAAPETIVKAYKHLRASGILFPIRGKGFFIADDLKPKGKNIFLLFDTFTSYKEVLYSGILEALGNQGTVSLFFHHYNSEVFKNLILSNLGNFTDYIILPFEDKSLEAVLQKIPENKLYLIDRIPWSYKKKYDGVFQDFENDVYLALKNAEKEVLKYSELNLIFRNTITIPPKELKQGFVRFCKDHKIKHHILTSYQKSKIIKNSAFIVIDDDDLVSLILKSKQDKLVLGTDVGIISYNDTPMKQVVADGISVISTDFRLIGINVIKMILENMHGTLLNPCRFIDRGSF